jgi:hypothetical protein
MDEMTNKGNSKLRTWNVHAVIIWHGRAAESKPDRENASLRIS